MLNIRLLVLSIVVSGCRAPPCTIAPTLVWPLGTGNGYQEILTNANSGAVGSVSYDAGYTSVGMNSAMSFSGVANSFVELNVPNHPNITDNNGDYSIRFYVYFNDIQTGTIFHYRSDTYDGTGTTAWIREIKMTVFNGIIEIQYTDFGSVTFVDTPVNAGVWYSIVYEKDLNQDGPKLYVDTLGNKETISILVKDKLTTFPGTIRIGANFDGTNPFSGRLACLQIFPCKEATDTTNDSNYCATQKTTSTSTTTTTEEPTTTTSTEQPTTTTTTEQPTTTTTTEQPTTTTTTEQPTTTTTTEQPTTTTTTEQPTTTTTTEQPTTTTTTEEPTTTTTTQQPTTTTTTEQPTTTTTTEQPTTTTTTEKPTTTTTTEQPTTTTTTGQPTTTTTTEQPTTTTALPTAISTQLPTTGVFPVTDYTALYDVSDVCFHYTRTKTDVTFGKAIDVIQTTSVQNVAACAKYCDKNLLCFSFTTEPVGGGFECKIGIKAPITTPLLGSVLYEL